MTFPKVSICIPTYNQVECLRRTLDSIVIQTYKDYEIIVTDDSKSDSVKNLVQQYRFGNNLKYFKNERRKGTPENWNEAIRHASGKYIKILHHDDWFMDKHSLKEFVALLDDNTHVDFACSATKIHYAAEKSKNRVHEISPDDLTALGKEPTCMFSGNLIGSPSATIYRKAVNVFFDPQMKWLVDIDFYIRVLIRNSNIANSDKLLIGTIADAEHKVTQQCVHNKDVQINEHYYLFNKIKSITSKTMLKKHQKYLWQLNVQWNIKSIQDIRDCGYLNPIPAFIHTMIRLNSISPLLSKIYLWWH